MKCSKSAFQHPGLTPAVERSSPSHTCISPKNTKWSHTVASHVGWQREIHIFEAKQEARAQGWLVYARDRAHLCSWRVAEEFILYGIFSMSVSTEHMLDVWLYITIRLPLKLPCTWVRTYISQTIDTSIYISTSMFTRIIMV